MPTNPQRLSDLSQQSTPEAITGFLARPESEEFQTGRVEQNAKLRELCRCVSEEIDSERIDLLLDQLYLALDERELLASLL
jgi:hypothetical protein